jgi:hypothetical protein
MTASLSTWLILFGTLGAMLLLIVGSFSVASYLQFREQHPGPPGRPWSNSWAGYLATGVFLIAVVTLGLKLAMTDWVATAPIPSSTTPVTRSATTICINGVPREATFARAAPSLDVTTAVLSADQAPRLKTTVGTTLGGQLTAHPNGMSYHAATLDAGVVYVDLTKTKYLVNSTGWSSHCTATDDFGRTHSFPIAAGGSVAPSGRNFPTGYMRNILCLPSSPR